MTGQVMSAWLTILVGVGGCLLYFWGSNLLLDRLLPANASNDAGQCRISNVRRSSGRVCSSPPR